ncbi:MAG: peptidylprolyl isomerase [Candidatus Marinimicrobia bacterium]|nr:peptidylprolyl isomerase [Candidatus Neomarinimicrobiota bacterium]
MALMTSMRNRMHFVLWALLILFVLSMTVGGLVGGANIIDEIFGRVDPRTTLGKVNSESISPDYFSQLVSQQLEQVRSSGQEINDQQINKTRKEVWDNLVQEILMQQEIKRLDISATNDEVLYHLRNNPPPFLQSNSSFLTNGAFDPVKYEQAISNPQGNEWAPVEQFMKNTYLPNYKLQQMILSSVSVTEDEVRDEYLKRNVDYTINAVHVTQRAFETEEVEPSEDEMLANYNERIDEFQRPEQRILRYVSWDKGPSASDSADVVTLVNDIIARVSKGESFADLANQYTTDPSNQVSIDSSRGGELGWFGKGQMVKPFEDAAFNANVGDIVGPVQTRFGQHIIKVLDKRTTGEKAEIHAAHILLKIEMSNQTRDALRKKSVVFSYDALDYGFDAALDTNHVEAKTSRHFDSEAEFISGIGSSRSAVRFAFKSELGDIGDVFDTDGAFIIATLDSVIPEGSTPFDDVKNGIKRDLTKEKTMVLTKSKAADYLMDIHGGKSILDILDGDDKLERAVNDTKKLSRGFTSVGRSYFVIGALLGANPGDIVGPVETARGHAIIELVSVADYDSTDFEVQENVLEQDLLSTKQNQAFRDWLEDLKTNADIVDNRQYYF